MNFLEITGNEEIGNYKWRRECSGIYHHWEMSVLNGYAVLHIVGIDKRYWGHIQLTNNYDVDLPCLYSTNNEGEYEPFLTPEDCAKILQRTWREIISTESRMKGL